MYIPNTGIHNLVYTVFMIIYIEIRKLLFLESAPDLLICSPVFLYLSYRSYKADFCSR